LKPLQVSTDGKPVHQVRVTHYDSLKVESLSLKNVTVRFDAELRLDWRPSGKGRAVPLLGARTGYHSERRSIGNAELIGEDINPPSIRSQKSPAAPEAAFFLLITCPFAEVLLSS
jgi:hypothetical protein